MQEDIKGSTAQVGWDYGHGKTSAQALFKGRATKVASYF